MSVIRRARVPLSQNETRCGPMQVTRVATSPFKGHPQTPPPKLSMQPPLLCFDAAFLEGLISRHLDGFLLSLLLKEGNLLAPIKLCRTVVESIHMLEKLSVDVGPNDIAHDKRRLLLAQPSLVVLPPHKRKLLGLERFSVDCQRKVGLSEGGVRPVVVEMSHEECVRAPQLRLWALCLRYHHKVAIPLEHGNQAHGRFAAAELEGVVLWPAHNSSNGAVLVLVVFHPNLKHPPWTLLLEKIELDQILKLLGYPQLHHLVQPLIHSAAAAAHPPPRSANPSQRYSPSPHRHSGAVGWGNPRPLPRRRLYRASSPHKGLSRHPAHRTKSL
mmetsp:Transcript_4142/g.9823  ORF Transcript_4142/g.9823 Transcript_4142/m.9823 type:complete len:328 (+) Transcript_4142:1000-1983(+)